MEYMEEILRVLEETAEDIHRKLEKIEPPEKEYVDGGSSDDDVLLVRRSDEDAVITSSSNEDQVDDGKMEDADGDETKEADDYETEVEEDSTEEEWYADGTPLMPYYTQNLPPRPRCFEGASYMLESANKIAYSADETNAKLFEDWMDLVGIKKDSNGTPQPCWPLPILPELNQAIRISNPARCCKCFP